MASQRFGATKNTVFSGLCGTLLVLFGTSLPVDAQSISDNKLKNDPTYSIHNYKHPNKALAARAWESEIVLGRRGRERRRVTVGDYKRTAQVEPGRSVIVLGGRRGQPANPEVLAGHNYKNPRPSSSVARKESRKQDKPIVVVPAEETATGNE